MATIRKEEAATAQWEALFLTDLNTRQESVAFVKRMMAVAVSYITYLRGIFPEDAYRSKYLGDLCVKVLREKCNEPGANKIVKWMMGSFDALEKQYLQIVFIGVCTKPDEPKHIIESYHFKFKYTEKGPEMNISRNNSVELNVTLEELMSDTVVLIRKLYLLMQNLGPLPNDAYLTMKLYYYDAITPVDYQPPGFKEGEDDGLWFEGTAVHFKVGHLQTAFHSFSVGASVEQGRVDVLQRAGQVGQAGQAKSICQGVPPQREVTKFSRKRTRDSDDLPSEDESAQFKKPRGHVAKKKAAVKTLARKKRRI